MYFLNFCLFYLCTESLMLHMDFSLAVASRCSGFPCCGAQALSMQA